MSDNNCTWSEKPLGELFGIARRVVVPAGFPGEQFVHYSIPAWDQSAGPITEPGSAIGSAKFLIDQPTILVSKLNPRISRVVLIENVDGYRHCASTEFIPYVAKNPDISIRFFKWLFRDPCFQRKLERVAMGSTNSHTRANPSETLRWSIACPPREVQPTIAYLLDTVEEAIAATQAVVTKLKQMRNGLLHDLLSRGLDENGELRDHIRNPQQFQKSPIGRIPIAWSLERLGSRLQRIDGIIQTGPFGSQLHANEYTTEGIPVIMPQDMLDGHVVQDRIARVPEARARELNRHRVEYGDVLFARRGDLSRCVSIGERERGWICGTGCLLMRFDTDEMNSDWLTLVYRNDASQRQVAGTAVGTTMVNLNTAVLFNLWIPFPPKAEQDAMVKVLAEASEMILREVVALLKLQALKAGLAPDLLTGRVPVPEGIIAMEAHE
jgi:type I restriction enzyme, S subunit